MRYLAKKKFPPYAFVPGKFPHPEKPGGHMEFEEVNVKKLDSIYDNEAYLYAIDLYNHGYYWEAHVWWEALWNTENRKGDKADFLKALIKFAAGKLKEKMNQTDIAQTHFSRGIELLDQLSMHDIFLGVHLESFKGDYTKITLENSTNVL